jgi:enoyl-CoA hydratase/carnithine racemase
MTSGLRVHVEPGVRILELDRPDRHNALTAAMIDGLTEALREAGEARDVGLVVLRGAGLDFCTGIDLDEFYASADSAVPDQEREARRTAGMLRALQGVRVPTVALVQGKALGIGATLAVACDLTVASSVAQFAFPEMTFGFIPAFASAIVTPFLGRKAAFELLTSGRTVRGEEARQLGLVSRVVPAEGFEAVTGSIVRGLCRGTAEQNAAFKRLFRALEGKPAEEALAIGQQANAEARASGAFREAARQFREMA